MPNVPVSEALQIAMRCLEEGRLQPAADIYRQILARDPRHVEALHRLGTVALQSGQVQAAVGLLHQASQLAPDDPDVLTMLGEAWRAAGRWADAEACFHAALRVEPDNPATHNNLANLLHGMGRVAQAIATWQRAIELDPALAVAYCNLSGALKDAGQLDDAEAAARRCLELMPHLAEGWCNLGSALTRQGRRDEAVAAFDRALQLKPALVAAQVNRAVAIHEQGRVADAMAAYRAVLDRHPDHIAAWNNLGHGCRDLGRFADALHAYDQALARAPDYADAHANRALVWLLQGDFARGLPEYEWRWRTGSFRADPLIAQRPQWTGGDVAGRTVLLHSEQGLGDALQFIRYAPRLAERGAKVLVECQAALADVLRTVAGVSDVIVRPTVPAADGPAAAHLPDFDLHCPLLSLPYAFGTRVESIPAEVPYLATEPARVADWSRRLATLGPGRRIGLCWAGRPEHPNDRNRSLPPAQLAPLAAVGGVQWISLQKGPAAPPPAGLTLVDWTADLHDLADTAALVANLDLVLSVDTAVVHLAGALARPTWVLLPFVPDWRWLLDRADSPWYPTLRLWRQRTAGDWASVVAAVSAALRAGG